MKRLLFAAALATAALVVAAAATADSDKKDGFKAKEKPSRTSVLDGRANGIPIAYLTGEREFMGCTLI